MSPPPLVTVIILNWNRLEETLRCLAGLKRLLVSGFRLALVVVDNGSNDDPTQAIRQSFRGATVIRLTENLGFAEANTLGMRYALKLGADYMWLLNNDTAVAPDSLRELVRQTHSPTTNSQRWGIVSPVIFELGVEGNKSERLQYGGGRIDWVRGTGKAERTVPKIEPRETEFVPGTAMLITKAAVERIGYLDARYFAYNEDTDYSIRAGRAGIRLAVVPRARIWHKLATSSGPKSALFWYLNSRNKWLFMATQAKLSHWPPFLCHYLWKPLLFRLLALIVRPSGENTIALKAALLGTIDGLRGKAGRPPARLLA